MLRPFIQKIYLYGYLKGIRSSRRLEKECLRNIEMQWLNEAICPNYHSTCLPAGRFPIFDFRKDNPKALKQLFKLFISFLKNADLIAKLKVWNSPYKRKVLLFVKMTYIKLFLVPINFRPNQITANYCLA